MRSLGFRFARLIAGKSATISQFIFLILFSRSISLSLKRWRKVLPKIGVRNWVNEVALEGLVSDALADGSATPNDDRIRALFAALSHASISATAQPHEAWPPMERSVTAKQIRPLMSLSVCEPTITPFIVIFIAIVNSFSILLCKVMFWAKGGLFGGSGREQAVPTRFGPTIATETERQSDYFGADFTDEISWQTLLFSSHSHWRVIQWTIFWP